MPDSSMFSAVDAIVRRTETDPWSGYRENCAKAERFYRGLHRQDLVTYLRNRFTHMWERGEIVEDLTPFMRRIVDRACGLWDRPIERTYYLGETPLPEDYWMTILFMDQEKQRQRALRDLDRYSYFCRSAILRVEWAERSKSLRYWVINPADLYIVRSMRSDDLQDLDALIYRLEDDSLTGMRRFCLWTPEIQLTYTGPQVGQMHRIDEQDDYSNPYGLLPFVKAEEENARGKFFPAYMEDLVDVAMELSSEESAQGANIAFNSFGQPIVPEGTKLTQPIGRGAPLAEGTGQAQITRYLNKNTPFQEISNELQRKLRTFAMTRGLPPGDFAFEGSAPESGFAKMIDSIPLIELREGRIVSVGQPVEEQLFKIESAVISKHTGVYLSRLSVDVTFPPIEILKTEEEKQREKVARRAAQRAALELNLTNPVRILMEEKGLSQEEAMAQVAENAQINAQYFSPPQEADETEDN